MGAANACLRFSRETMLPTHRREWNNRGGKAAPDLAKQRTGVMLPRQSMGGSSNSCRPRLAVAGPASGAETIDDHACATVRTQRPIGAVPLRSCLAPDRMDPGLRGDR